VTKHIKIQCRRPGLAWLPERRMSIVLITLPCLASSMECYNAIVYLHCVLLRLAWD